MSSEMDEYIVSRRGLPNRELAAAARKDFIAKADSSTAARHDNNLKVRADIKTVGNLPQVTSGKVGFFGIPVPSPS